MEIIEKFVGFLCNLDIAAIVSICVSGLVAILTLFFNYRIEKRKLNEVEIDKLKELLEKFYYPYLMLSEKNTSLYNLIKVLDDNSMLIFLLEGKQFKKNDRQLTSIIIDNDRKMIELITNNMNLIEDSEIRTNLVKMLTHYTLICEAYDSKLKGDVKRFGSHVYPSIVNELIVSKTRNIENEIEKIKKRQLLCVRMKKNKLSQK